MSDNLFGDEMLRVVRAMKHMLPCCPNCEHFRSRVVGANFTTEGTLLTEDEHCGLDPEKRRPPARIVAFGCPAFSGDVPF